MKRWILTIQGNDYKPKIYAETSEKARHIFNSEVITDIQPFTDMTYLEIIETIKNQSDFLGKQNIKNNNIREWYKCRLPDGIVRFRLYKDLDDDLYFDIAEYQFMSNDSLVYPVTFTYSNPKNLYNLFFTPLLFCEIPSYRIYGEPKLSKPTELRNIKSSFSIDWNKHCKCQCFVKDNDLWIKHRDFFSKPHKPNDEDIGTPLTYRLEKYFNVNKAYLDKFIYSDTWGDIILRNEAWIVFRNFKQTIQRDRHPPIQSMMKTFINADVLKQNHIKELNNDWESFFERVCKAYKNLTIDNKKVNCYK